MALTLRIQIGRRTQWTLPPWLLFFSSTVFSSFLIDMEEIVKYHARADLSESKNDWNGGKRSCFDLRGTLQCMWCLIHHLRYNQQMYPSGSLRNCGWPDRGSSKIDVHDWWPEGLLRTNMTNVLLHPVGIFSSQTSFHLHSLGLIVMYTFCYEKSPANDVPSCPRSK